MKIASSELQLSSQHLSVTRHTVKESLRMWVGERPAEGGRPGVGNALHGRGNPVSLSPQAHAAHAADKAAEIDPDAALENDPRSLIIKFMVELLTGRELKVLRSGDLKAEAPPVGSPTQAQAQGAAQLPAGFGLEYDRHESHYEAQHTQFSAAGVVQTADGREIRFQLDLVMSREYYREENISLRLGDAARVKDPLVINFHGPATLGEGKFSFDLDADGSAEEISFVGRGSGFLALDGNGDGRINDGSELFGPRTGDGFLELAVHDQDRNGWIDESDAVFKELRIWTRDADGRDRLQTLAEAGIGAISLGRVATPFDLKTAGSNELLGQIRSSGVYLNENGTVGSIQQIDLVV